MIFEFKAKGDRRVNQLIGGGRMRWIIPEVAVTSPFGGDHSLLTYFNISEN